jgi:putative DNA primase/helicase
VTTLETALSYLEAGWSLVPVLADGSKSPSVKWKQYQATPPSEAQLASWYKTGNLGIALIHGEVSGRSEVLDFDSYEAWESFTALVREHGAGELLDRFPRVITPSGGRHVYWRIALGKPFDTPLDGNLKLAMAADRKTLIETRGEGGYTIAPGSPAACHPVQKAYQLQAPGRLTEVPTVSGSERTFLLGLARSLNRFVEPERMSKPPVPRTTIPSLSPSLQPGADFNGRSSTASMLELLTRHGWTCGIGRDGGYELLRPGKKGRGSSATLGIVAEGVLYVFSSNATPFEPQHGYDPFAIYTHLEAGGDWALAASQLAGQGFGAPLPERVTLRINKYQPAPTVEDEEEFPIGPRPKEAGCEHPGKEYSEFNLTELGVAERLVKRHGKNLHWSASHDWMLWTGTHWGSGERAAVECERLTKHTVRCILEESAYLMLQAKKIEDQTERNAAIKKANDRAKFSLTFETKAKIGAVAALAQSEEGIHVPYEELDANPYLMTLANGTLELRSGTLRGHRREDLITTLVPVTFDPEATCPVWEKFLARVLPDTDLRRYVQAATGYSLTGDVSEQCLFFLYGKGANGKSTFLNTILSLMGALGHQASPELLVAKREMIRDDVAALAGKRFVATIETDEGRTLAEALMKTLTGGDKITARFLYKNSFSFDPTFKIWLAANHKPVVRNNDHGVWRRIKLVPFTEQIREEEKDPHLASKLARELPGILNWALAGLKIWQEEGLQEPKCVREGTEEYRSESDQLGQFVSECCVIGPAMRVRPAQLYQKYTEWCESRREKAKSMIAFGRALQEGHDVSKREIAGITYYFAIGLKDEREDLSMTPPEQSKQTEVRSFLSRRDPAKTGANSGF